MVKSKSNLVKKKVTVKRGGKTFERYQWVKAGEDEPEEKKSKKVEVKDEPKSEKISLDIFTVGDEISMMGEALTIEKIDANEKTIKMSDGKVYTLKAAKLYSKPLLETKYKVDDKINFNGKEQTITKVNRGLGIIGFADGTMHSFDDIETFSKEPKKEITIKDLKPVKKEKKIVKSELSKNKSVLLSDVAKSSKEATKIVEGSGWVWDNKSEIFPDVSDYNDYPIYIHTNDKGKIYGMSQSKKVDEYGYKDKDGKIGEIEYIEINTPMRGQGYGKRMIKSVVNTLSDCDKITLVSLDANSNKFYEAIGMKKASMKRNCTEYVGDKKWMNKIIGAEKSKSTESKISKGMSPGNVESMKSLGDMNIEGGINDDYSQVVTFKDESKGIYKTTSFIDTQGEVNFKGVESILGWNNAPDLEVGDFGYGEGSCQKWVSDIVEHESVKINDKHYDDLAKVYIMDVVVGNYDRHSDNIKLDKDNKFWAIDNDTWGSKTNLNLNIKDGMGKMGDWVKMDDAEKDKFQSHINKNIKSVMEHEGEIIKYFEGLNKDSKKMNAAFDDKYVGYDLTGSDKPKTIKAATDNILDNISKISKHNKSLGD